MEVLTIKISIPWIMGLNQAHVFKERFIKSRSSMEVTSLQSWGRRWIGLHRLFVYCQHMIELNNLQKNKDYWCPCFISSFTLTRCDGPCCFNENLNWFNPMCCVKFAILQQCIIHIHPCFSLVALLIAFFPWYQNCNHCYQKQRTWFMAPLPNAC